MSAPVRPAIGARIVAYCNCTFAFSTAARVGANDGVERRSGRARRVALLARADSALDEIFHSLRNHLGVGSLRGVARQVRFGLIQRGLERPMIEREQHLAGLHVVTLLEIDGLQLARHLCPYGDCRERLHGADNVHVERHFLLDDIAHGDGNRGLGRARAGGLSVACRTGRQRRGHPY